MKASHLLLVGSFFATAAFADLTLTQEIKQEPAAGGKGTEMTMTSKIKGDKLRVDAGSDITTITNTKTGDTTTIMNQQKVFMEVPGETVKKMQKAALDQANAQAASTDAKPAAPQATGNKQTINGFSCEEYVSSDNGTKVTAWVTKDIPNAEQLLKELDSISAQIIPFGKGLEAQKQLQGFPVQVIIESPTVGKMSVTTSGLSEDALSDSDFEAPAGYKKMEMPKIPGQ